MSKNNPNKYIILFTLLLLLLPVALAKEREIPTPIKVSDYVYINEDYASVSAKPSTLQGSGWVTLTFTNKLDSNDYDILYNFEDEGVTVAATQFYSPHPVTVKDSYTCEGKLETDEKTKTYQCLGTYNYTNNTEGKEIKIGDTYIIQEGSFEEIKENTVYYNTRQIQEDWTDNIWTKEQKQQITDKNNIKYTKTNYLTAETNQEKVMRVYLEVPPCQIGTSCKTKKYTIYILPKTYNGNIDEAKKDGQLIILDPYTLSDSSLVLDYSFNNNVTNTTFTQDTKGLYNGSITVRTGQANGSLQAKLGQALNFTTSTSASANGYVNAGNVPLTDAATYAVWFYVTGADGTDWITGTILGKTVGTSSCTQYPMVWHLGGYTANKSQFNKGGCSGKALNSNKSFTPGTWVHQVVTFNTTYMKMWQNGELVDANLTSGMPSTSSNNNLLIGTWVNTGNRGHLVGYIDQVSIWNRVITDEEAAILYNSANGYEYPFQNPYTNISVNFLNQTPSDITSTNVIGSSQLLNLTYNITAGTVNVSNTSVVFYTKTNTTSNDYSIIINGTPLIGYQSNLPTYSCSGNYSQCNVTYMADDGEIYPATYNLNQETQVENTIHNVSQLTGTNHYAKVKLLNVSNTSQYSFFEIMSLGYSGTGAMTVYYCNSTYTTGNVQSNTNCYSFGTIASNTPYNHIESAYSAHQYVTMPIVAGKVGTVTVTPNSSLIVRGAASTIWNVSYVNTTSRTDAASSTTNRGVSWNNIVGTIDAHLHQYDGTETFYYYVCANSTDGNQTCSSTRNDTINLTILPPSQPHITQPDGSLNYYPGNIQVNWTAAEVVNSNSNITNYTLALYYANETQVSSSIYLNGATLNYTYDASTITPEQYVFGIYATSNNSLNSSTEFSEPFYITNMTVYTITTNPATPINYLTTLYNVSINASNAANVSVNMTSADGTPVSTGYANYANGLWTYTANYLMDRIETYTITTLATEAITGLTLTNTTNLLVIKTQNASIADGYFTYALGTNNISTTNLDLISTYGFTQVRLTWTIPSTITQASFNTMLYDINNTYTRNMKAGYVLLFSSTNFSSYTNQCNNITSYFTTLSTSPYSETLSYILLDEDGSNTGNATSFFNGIATCLMSATRNKFPIYGTPATGYDSNYIANYTQPITYAPVGALYHDFIGQERTNLRNTTSLTRVYRDTSPYYNTTFMALARTYYQGIISQLRGTPTGNNNATDTNRADINNGDIVLFNNGSATTITSNISDKIGNMAWDYTHETLYNITTTNISIPVAATEATMLFIGNYTKLIMTDSNTATLYGGTNGAVSSSMDYFSNGTTDGSLSIVGAYDARQELWDPSYGFNNIAFVTYEQLQYTQMTDFSNYPLIIIAGGDNTPTIVNTSLQVTTNPTILSKVYGYTSVADYDNLNSTGGNETNCNALNPWETAKQNEAYNWTDNYQTNVFMDGFDIGYSITPDCFEQRIKRISDNVQNVKNKKVIFNTYTIYQSVAHYGDAVMRESCFSRWDGTVGTPTYSYENMNLMIANAQYMTTLGKPVICMAFGDVNDYDKLSYDYHAFAVLYGTSNGNTFAYGQPNFQIQREIRTPNFGVQTQNSYDNTNPADYARRYSNGVAHFNPLRNQTYANGKYYWFDDGKTINSVKIATTVQIYGSSCSATHNMVIQINGNQTQTIDECADVGTTQWSVNTTIKDFTASYTPNGHYYITYYPSTRASATGMNLYNKANSQKGVHAWYDASAYNPPSTEAQWTAYGRSGTIGDFNTTVFQSNLTINQTTSSAVDTTTYINQYETSFVSNVWKYKNFTFNSSKSYFIPVLSPIITVNTLAFSNLTYNGTILSYTNNSDCLETNPTLTYTNIGGQMHGVCRYNDSTNSYYRIETPHLSEMIYTLGTETDQRAPNITSVTITPSTAYYNDTLIAVCNATDDNGDYINYNYTWYKNNNLITGNNTQYYYYQESANTSNQTGTDGPSLSYTGTYNAASYYLYINYTKPTQSSNQAIWQVKHGSATDAAYNITIDNECYLPQNLQLRIYSNDSDGTSQPSCYNGSTWKNIGTTMSGLTGGSISAPNPSLLYDGDWTTHQAFSGDTAWRTKTDTTVKTLVYEEAIYWGMIQPKILPPLTHYDNYTFQCIASDILNSSEQVNTTIQISNYAPVIGTPTIVPTIAYGTTAALTCYNSTVTDAESDTVTLNYLWYKNGVSTGITTQSITNSSYIHFDNITCQITPNDGYINGLAQNSSAVEILNIPLTQPIAVAPTIISNVQAHFLWNQSYDEDGDTITYMVYLDNTNIYNTTALDLYWNVTEANHTWYIIATDGYLTNTSNNLTFYADGTSPTVVITSPLNNSNLTSLTPNVTFTMTDNYGGPGPYSAYILNNTQIGTAYQNGTNGFTINYTLTDNLTYTLLLQVYDTANNYVNNSVTFSVLNYCTVNGIAYTETTTACDISNHQTRIRNITAIGTACCQYLNNSQAYCTGDISETTECSFAPTGVGQPIASFGAGFAMFINYIKTPLFILLVGLIFVGMIAMIFMPIGKAIKDMFDR